MSRSGLLALRLLLLFLFAASIAAQVTSGAIARAAQDGILAGVLMGLAIVGGLCVEVVLVSVWMLVSMVQEERIFEDRGHADRWVNATIGALVAAAAVATAGSLAVLIVQAWRPEASGWTLALLAAGAAGVSAALALLVVVMRRLLHAAIRLRSELAEVI